MKVMATNMSISALFGSGIQLDFLGMSGSHLVDWDIVGTLHAANPSITQWALDKNPCTHIVMIGM